MSASDPLRSSCISHLPGGGYGTEGLGDCGLPALRGAGRWNDGRIRAWPVGLRCYGFHGFGDLHDESDHRSVSRQSCKRAGAQPDRLWPAFDPAARSALGIPTPSAKGALGNLVLRPPLANSGHSSTLGHAGGSNVRYRFEAAFNVSVAHMTRSVRPAQEQNVVSRSRPPQGGDRSVRHPRSNEGSAIGSRRYPWPKQTQVARQSIVRQCLGSGNGRAHTGSPYEGMAGQTRSNIR